MTDDVIFSGAQIKWSADGYVLEFRALLYDREAAIFERKLAALLGPSAIGDGQIRLEVGRGYRWEREGGGGAGVVMSEVRIVTPRSLFDLDPVLVRARIEQAGREARMEAFEQEERDRRELLRWVERFNRPDGSAPN